MTTYLLTKDSPERFNRIFNFLAASKNAKTDEVKLEASFLVLGELPIESVEVSAQTLCKEANPFMPDDGSWYELADNHASKQVVIDTEKMKALPVRVEQEEIETLEDERDKFFKTFERIIGKPIPNKEKWESAPVQITTYHCRFCSDTGWQSMNCTEDELCTSCHIKKHHLYDHEYVERCVCWDSNPALKAERAKQQLQNRRRANKRP